MLLLFLPSYGKKKKTNINLNPKYLSLTKEIVFAVMEVGIPAAIQNLLNVTGMTILNNFVAGYGSSAVAAVGIAQKVYMVPIQVALGGTQGVMPLVGYSYASKNKQRFEETIQTVIETSGAVYGSYYDIMLDFCTIPDQTVYEK